MCTEKKVEIFQSGSSDYSYKKNNEELNVGIKNFIFENNKGNPVIISNYFISSENSFDLFATIVWENIDYVNDDYNPYNYDPEPLMIIYRDNLPKEKEEKFLKIIDDLSKKLKEPTTHYKHFNPELPKVKLSDVDNEKYSDIINVFNGLISHFSSDE